MRRLYPVLRLLFICLLIAYSVIWIDMLLGG